jgi:hypothetical protein
MYQGRGRGGGENKNPRNDGALILFEPPLLANPPIANTDVIRKQGKSC